MQTFKVSKTIDIVKDGKIYLIYSNDTLIQITFKLFNAVVVATELNGETLIISPETNERFSEILLNESDLPFMGDLDYPEPDDESIW